MARALAMAIGGLWMMWSIYILVYAATQDWRWPRVVWGDHVGRIILALCCVASALVGGNAGLDLFDGVRP